MFISRELRSKNIAEYLLYMFHLEDMIRALEFDESKIDKHISGAYPEENRAEAGEWYKNISEMMKYEKVQEKGHIHIVRNQIRDVEEFLLKVKENNDEDFNKVYSVISPAFDEIRNRNNAENISGLAEMALNIVYWFMAQKLAGNTVSEEYTEQIRHISSFLAVLSLRFNQYENGKYELP
jgi:hypothetical protein